MRQGVEPSTQPARSRNVFTRQQVLYQTGNCLYRITRWPVSTRPVPELHERICQASLPCFHTNRDRSHIAKGDRTMKILNKIWKQTKILFWCYLFRDHDWTCSALEGITPDREKVAVDPVGYFEEYSQMYCKRCDAVYMP